MCGRMDQNAIGWGGTFINTGDLPSVEQLPVIELPVVVGDSQEPRQAKKILNEIKERLQNDDPVVHNAFPTTHKCVLEAKKAIYNCNYEALGSLMNIQQNKKILLVLQQIKLNSLCEVAREVGALGAKQMGAGGGGCMVAVCPGKQKEVEDAINDAGGKAFAYNIFHYSDRSRKNIIDKRNKLYFHY